MNILIYLPHTLQTKKLLCISSCKINYKDFFQMLATAPRTVIVQQAGLYGLNP